MRKGKRLLALNLALLLVVVLLPLQALAADITLDTTVTFTRSADTMDESAEFTAPETALYAVELTCPDYPDYEVVSTMSTDAGLHIYAQDENANRIASYGLHPIYLLNEGQSYSFGLLFMDPSYAESDFYGDWTWHVKKLEPIPLEKGVTVQNDSPLHSFTPKEDGAVQVVRTDWRPSYSRFVIYIDNEHVKRGWIGDLSGSNGNGVFTFYAYAGETYYLQDSNPFGELTIIDAPRSGVYGDDKGNNWSLSDDGVLTLSGGDSWYSGERPWEFFDDEIRKVVFENGTKIYADLYRGVSNLQELDVGERADYFWKDGALYHTDADTAAKELVWVRPDVKTLELGEDVSYIWFNAFQNAKQLETLTMRSDADAGMDNECLLYGAAALTDIYYYPEDFSATPFYGIEPVVDLNYKNPAPVVHYMAADQELPEQRTQTYPATRVGMAEMLYDFMDLPDGTYSAEKADETFNDLAGLTQRQKEAIEMLVEREISKGSSESTFSPELTNNRAQAATFMWRALQDDYYPYSSDYELYDDVSRSDYYFESANWCNICPFVEFDGVTGRTFGPKVELKTLTITTPVITKDGVEYITGDKVITVSPEEAAEPTTQPDDPTPASPQPTTKPDDPKPSPKPDDTKPSPKPDDTKPAPKPVENPFVDVQSGDYFMEPVLWALNHDPQITDGMTENTFAPAETCTRGQVVTFLWRAMGCEEPTKTDNPFSDVKADDYFYKAVLWAVEKGITDGTSATTFSPNDPCTRAHVVTFLCRAEGSPKGGSSNPFADVAAGEYYTDAVLWAVSKQITDGTSDTTFSPADPCTRGQIVTFLYRDMAK